MNNRQLVDQFFFTLGKIPAAVALIRDRQLWRGIDKYSWVFRLLVLAAIILSFSFISIVADWIRGLFQIDSPQAFLSSMSSFTSTLFTEGYHTFSSGMMKYVLLLLAEVLVFHFMQRSLQELRGQPVRTHLGAFLSAQARMIKVVIRAWVLELIFTILISIAFGIVGILSFLEPAALFVVQCYFFGTIILDNYFEQFGLSIKQSLERSKQYMGVALALGTVLYLLMLIPLVGVVAGTILVSVTAVLTMESSTPLPLRPEVDGLTRPDELNHEIG